MDVRVLKSGEEQLAVQVDDLGSGPDQVRDLRFVPDGEDAVPSDGHRARPGAGGVDGVHGAGDEDEVGRPGRSAVQVVLRGRESGRESGAVGEVVRGWDVARRKTRVAGRRA